MVANEIKTTINGPDGSEKKSSISDVLDKLKGFFQKKDEGGEKKVKKTKNFALTRRESIISIVVAVVSVVGAGIYGRTVWGKYQDINENTESLKKMNSYNVSIDKDMVDTYGEGDEINTITDIIGMKGNVESLLKDREMFKNQQKSYYEILLQNLYLPSLNIWKNPYTKNFDMSVLGQKYLEKDKFQDLYLIQYWSDFIKYVGNDADYNTINNISIGDMVELGNSDYFYVPVTVSFSSPNKRSFLLLVNKLSMTSNTKNIALLNEFFFYLLKNIKENKEAEINKLMKQYWTEFSSSDEQWPQEFEDLNGSLISGYVDKVIGYNLYQRINDEDGDSEDGDNEDGDDKNLLIDDDIIIKTIRDNVSCEKDTSNSTCFYRFRDKYRNLPYLAYKIGLDNGDEDADSSDRTEGLKNFLKDLPSIIAITNFGFDKHSDASFLNDSEEQYEGDITFNAYGRTISNAELEEATTKLGKLCFGDTSPDKMLPDKALDHVNKSIVQLGGNETINTTSLLELQALFQDIQGKYNSMTNYNKMIKIFELWRMLNDANLCNL